MQNQNSVWGGFGLERETLRVDKNGQLAQTPHPFTDPHISRDFCDDQVELITPVCTDIETMLQELDTLDRDTRQTLANRDEYIWLYSNPPILEKDSDILLAQYHGAEANKYAYRHHLEERYGKRRMLYSGIHFNVSFSLDYLKDRYEHEKLSEETYAQFCDRFYFRLMKHLTHSSWLLVMLTAASPTYDKSLFETNVTGTAFDGHASMRNGLQGYWNRFTPILDYTNLSTYLESVGRYVRSGMLLSAAELYMPIRLKPKGDNRLETLAETGVDHVELRMFDLNPLEPLGIAQEDLEFACLWMEYLTTLPDFEFTPHMQADAMTWHKDAALYDLEEISVQDKPALTVALDLLDSLCAYFSENADALHILEFERRKLTGTRPCETVRSRIGQAYTQNVMEISARTYANVSEGEDGQHV